MILGFTGSRKGPTPEQWAALPSVLARLPDHVIHGGAIGWDEEFHRYLVKVLSQPPRQRVTAHIYAVKGERFQFWTTDKSKGLHYCFNRVFIRGYTSPIGRNTVIAAKCDHLLACPNTMTRTRRGGTWFTVQAARDNRKPTTPLSS